MLPTLPHDPKKAVRDSKTDCDEHSGYSRNEKRPSRDPEGQHSDGETGNEQIHVWPTESQ